MCEVVVVLDDERWWAFGAKGFAGLPAWDRPDIHGTADDEARAARWEFGFADPFVFGLSRDPLDRPTDERAAELDQCARPWVASEIRRVVGSTQRLQADDLRTNRAIMATSWTSIGDARLIVADLTSANAHGFYARGIAGGAGVESGKGVETTPGSGTKPRASK